MSPAQIVQKLLSAYIPSVQAQASWNYCNVLPACTFSTQAGGLCGTAYVSVVSQDG
jgi:hypothetical protein